MALNKNMPSRNRRSRLSRLRHQTISFSSAARPACNNVKGKKTLWRKKKSFQQKFLQLKQQQDKKKTMARLISIKVEKNKIPIKAILVPETLRGYIFVEADGAHLVQRAIEGIKHVRGMRPEFVSFAEVEKYIVRKPVIEELSEDDIVEVTGGPFKGMRAKITRIDKTKGEVTLELLEATFTLPITVNSDYVKLVEKAKTISGEV